MAIQTTLSLWTAKAESQNMLSFTLDTNCVLALDDAYANAASHRVDEARAVEALVIAHVMGISNVGVVAISASERQRDYGYLETFSVFQQRLASLGLAHLDLLEPMLYYDITFWDASLWSDDKMETLERSIHEILFPNIPFLWTDYCTAIGIDPSPETRDQKWRNAKCDVQAFWSHAWRNRDVFVTSDRNFHAESKKKRLLALVGGRIETPESAALL